MYQLGKRKRKQSRLRRGVIAIASCALIGFGIFIVLELANQPGPTIQNAPSQTTKFTAVAAKNHIDEPLFTVDLPDGWQVFKLTTNLDPPTYSFRSSGEQIQLLSIYIDNIPSNLAVNRVAVVTAQGNGMIHGGVSDNCTSFTNPTPAQKNSGSADGKWQGTNFLCDVGNYERNVVGISSTSGINQVQLTGATARTHKVFLAYTDNAINPDYAVFYSIIESFRLK